MNKANKAFIERYKKSIQTEYEHLHDRIVVLSLFNILLKTNPAFFDKDEDVIIEPWKTIFEHYADMIDEDYFIKRLQQIQKEKHNPIKRRSAKTGSK
jgi:hypothetical protein